MKCEKCKHLIQLRKVDRWCGMINLGVFTKVKCRKMMFGLKEYDMPYVCGRYEERIC